MKDVLEQLRDELDAARSEIDAVLHALGTWEGGANYPNEDMIVGELDGAEQSILRAQALVVRLIDAKQLGMLDGLETPPHRLVFERWRHRAAPDPSDQAQS